MKNIIRILLLIHILLVATMVGYYTGWNFADPKMLYVFAGLTAFALSILLKSQYIFTCCLSLTFTFIYIALNVGMIYWLIFGLGTGENGVGEIVIVCFFVPGLLLALAYAVQVIMDFRKAETIKVT